MKQKLNIITLGVADLDRALDFYVKGLGWKKSKASQGDIAFFQLGTLVLALYPRELLAEDACIENEKTGFSGVTIAYNASSEQEVDAVLKQVEKLGASILKPAQKVFWGGYSGYFRDLDGHVFEVAYNPFFDLDEAGFLNLE